MASGLCNINPSQGAVTFIVLKCAPSRSPQEMYKGPMWHLHSQCVRLDSVIFPDHSSKDCTEQLPVRLPNTQCIANKQKQRGPCSHQSPISEDCLSGTVFKLNSFKPEILETSWNPIMWYLPGTPGQVAGSEYFAASTSVSNWTSTECELVHYWVIPL